MIEEIIRLKAQDYDILLELEEARKKIAPLEKKHSDLQARIKELTAKQPSLNKDKKIATDIDDDTRIKEQKIMEKRLNKAK